MTNSNLFVVSTIGQFQWHRSRVRFSENKEAKKKKKSTVEPAYHVSFLPLWIFT